MNIINATEKDIPELVALLNSAYRGEGSKKGWTTEADMISGELRTDEANLKKLMQIPDAIFLKAVNEENKIEGCVFLDIRGNRLYLGMLSVSPALQAKGTGKELMKAAELHARKNNCEAIFMRVISIRDELISWYQRQGYQKTGATEPFPENDPFGTPTRTFHFDIMEKRL
jgi:N-acetylglutamate synthase-like GNAT family acetyltransferase